MTDDLDPLSQLEIETTIRRLMRDATDNTQEVARTATAAAEARTAYKIGYAQEFLRANGSMELRKQIALDRCEDLLANHEIAEAELMGARLAGENIRANLTGAQSLNSNIRDAVRNSSGYGG